MCGNKVDDLESRVQELEASVEGLTDELVECKQRLNELEGETDDGLEASAHTSTAGASAEEAESTDESADAEAPKSGDDTEDSTEEERDNDIIVA